MNQLQLNWINVLMLVSDVYLTSFQFFFFKKLKNVKTKSKKSFFKWDKTFLNHNYIQWLMINDFWLLI